MNLRHALNGSIRRMNHINRYSSLPVLKHENVAQHSWQVAFIAYCIAADIGTEPGGAPVDLGAVLAKAIVHDVSEAMSGDVIRSYKYSTPEMEAATRSADDLNVGRLSVEFGERVGAELLNDWRGAKDATVEGRIVAFADMATVVTYCVEEHRLGNTMLDEDRPRGILEAVHRLMMDRFGGDPLLEPYLRQLFPYNHWRSAYQLGVTIDEPAVSGPERGPERGLEPLFVIEDERGIQNEPAAAPLCARCGHPPTWHGTKRPGGQPERPSGRYRCSAMGCYCAQYEEDEPFHNHPDEVANRRWSAQHRPFAREDD